MSVETVVIDSSKENAGPSLEDSAKAMGIDVANIDPTAPEQTATPRPSWLPEKFKSEVDFAAAYAELEKKLGEQGSESKTDPAKQEAIDKPLDQAKKDEAPKEGEVTQEQAKEAAEKAGLNFDELSAKFWEKGSLEDSDYEALEKSGIPKHLVDQFAAGQKAVVQLERMEAISRIGTEDQYNEMLAWAADTFSEAEVEAYNKAVNGPDKSARFMAMDGLKARYSAVVGNEPARQAGGKAPTGALEVYESLAQMKADMSKPEYQKDPAFRAKVEAKLARSNIM